MNNAISLANEKNTKTEKAKKIREGRVQLEQDSTFRNHLFTHSFLEYHGKFSNSHYRITF